MRVIWLLVIAAGCIESQLVPCGELACPAGDVCLAGSQRCVSPAQLEICGTKAPGEDCVVGGIAGRCEDGACTPVICGNRVLDPGELCDDGNQISGDGCSGTCASTEICGNGVVDVARGEGCDCGGSANPSSLCAFENSDDLAAECALDCTPRYCGDGIVNTIEQCDGSIPAGPTCGSFGYYEGTLTCSTFCQLDPQPGCIGRCGDGVTDSVHGEYCDQTLPSGKSCLDLGLDLGTLTCGPACGPELADCHYLGFSRAHSVEETVVDLWGGAGRIGVVYESGTAFVLAGATTTQATGTFVAITGTPTTVWVAGITTVARWSAQTNQWTSETAPWPNNKSVTDLWAADALGLFAITADAEIYRRDGNGTWSITGGSWPTLPWFGHTRTTPYAVWSTGAASWNGSAWVPFTAVANSIDFAEDPAGNLYVATVDDLNGSLFIQQGASFVQHRVDADSLASDGFGVYMADRKTVLGGTVPFVDVIQLIGTTPRWFEAPVLLTAMASDGGAMPYVGLGAQGLFRVERGSWAYEGYSLDLLAGTGDFVSYVPGGPLVRSLGGNVETQEPTGSWAPVTEPERCIAAAIPASRTLYCLPATNKIWEGATATTLGISGSLLWVAPNEQGAAVAGKNTFAWRATGAWTSTTPSIWFIELTGTAINDLYAIDVTGKLWRFDGSTWTAASASFPGLTGLVVTPTKVFAMGLTQMIIYDKQTQQVQTLTTPLPFASLAGTSETDLFGGVRQVEAGRPVLWRYDGAAWTPVRLAPEVTPQIGKLHAVGDAVLVQGKASGFLMRARMDRLQRTVPW